MRVILQEVETEKNAMVNHVKRVSPKSRLNIQDKPTVQKELTAMIPNAEKALPKLKGVM